jgi:hypothetical protein
MRIIVFVKGKDVTQAETGDRSQSEKATCEFSAGSNKSMSWKEASLVSLVLTMANVFIVFLTLYDLSSIALDPASFAFDLFKFAGASFFGTFITLTELSKYQSR